MGAELTNNQILLKKCVAEEFGECGNFPDEATFFEFFAASQVLKDYDLSDEEIENGLVGSGNDGGCDGIYIFLNKNLILSDQVEALKVAKESAVEMVVIQAKRENSFKEDALMKWKTISGNLLSLSNSLNDYKARYNEGVLDAYQLFRDLHTKLLRNKVKLTFRYIYVTYANEVHPNVAQQAIELKETVKKYYPSANVEVELIGADELFEKYNSISETIVNLPLVEVPIALGRNKNYIALVSLKEYFKFITASDGSLQKKFFEANVRDYQGKNSVNSAIRDTLENNSSEDFWWLNNGITILTSEATMVNNRELQLTNPEIVNGLQTSNEIYLYLSKNQELFEEEKRNLLVRVIVPEGEESRDNIIFSTNNQTNIPKSSLRVTDAIHLQIELYFRGRGLYYDRRKNYYKNQGIKSNEIVSVSFLAQCLITLFLRKPDYARARPSTLLTDDDTYGMLYEENQDLEVFYKSAMLGKIIQNNVKKTATFTAAEKSDIMFYLLYGVVADILKKTNICFNDVKLLDLDLITDEKINVTKEKIYTLYKAHGGNGRVAKSSDFVNKVDSVLGITNS